MNNCIHSCLCSNLARMTDLNCEADVLRESLRRCETILAPRSVRGDFLQTFGLVQSLLACLDVGFESFQGGRSHVFSGSLSSDPLTAVKNELRAVKRRLGASTATLQVALGNKVAERIEIVGLSASDWQSQICLRELYLISAETSQWRKQSTYRGCLLGRCATLCAKSSRSVMENRLSSWWLRCR